MAQEIELKLAFPNTAHEALLRHPLVKGAKRLGRAQTLINTYFDTEALTLRQARIAVRTRKSGARWLQTIKCASASQGGLSSRPEWEQPYRNGRFDFSAVDHPDVRKLLEKHADSIEPVFTTEFRRETRVFEPEHGTRILLMIDTGNILAGGREAPISELELELETGDPLHLLDFALRLAADLPLLPEDASKAERGYSLFRNKATKPIRAGRSGIQAEHTPLQAFRTIAFEAVHAWQANANGVQHSRDPEFIHQLRVSLRRLRTLLRFFAPILPNDSPETFAQHWSKIIGELARKVSVARDMDVLREHILAPLSDSHKELYEELIQQASKESKSAHESARAALSGPGCGVLLLSFTRALYMLQEPNEMIDLTAFARKTLARQRQRARQRFANAAALGTDEAMHALRIALKRLRYGIEFFAPLFPAKPMSVYQRKLSAVQESLGFLNDLSVARETLGRWAQSKPDMLVSRAFVAGWHAPRAAKVRRKVLSQTEPLLWGVAPWKH